MHRKTRGNPFCFACGAVFLSVVSATNVAHDPSSERSDAPVALFVTYFVPGQFYLCYLGGGNNWVGRDAVRCDVVDTQNLDVRRGHDGRFTEQRRRRVHSVICARTINIRILAQEIQKELQLQKTGERNLSKRH